MQTRALVYDRYGDASVLHARDTYLAPPRPGEVLVRVRAAALNPKDVFVRKGRFRVLTGKRFPKKTGVDFSGEVVEGGDFAPGTRVYGALEEVTYLRGTFADHVVVREKELAPMPDLSFEEAASLPLSALTALQALRDLAHLAPGDRLLIHGASGGVGTVAIQIGKALGAHVTTTSSEKNRALCKELGADETLDRSRTITGRYRVVFDVFGNLGFDPNMLEKHGRFVSTVPSVRILMDSIRTLGRAKLVIVRSRRRDLETITRMVEAKQLRPVLDRVVPFDRAIEAVRHLETKQARGKIVVTL